MNKNSFCICCYNKNTSFVNKCHFNDHKICKQCHKEYTSKFNKFGCMFCNPFEQKKKLHIHNVNLILCANIFICILIIYMFYILILIISSFILTIKQTCQELI